MDTVHLLHKCDIMANKGKAIDLFIYGFFLCIWRVYVRNIIYSRRGAD